MCGVSPPLSWCILLVVIVQRSHSTHTPPLHPLQLTMLVANAQRRASANLDDGSDAADAISMAAKRRLNKDTKPEAARTDTCTPPATTLPHCHTHTHTTHTHTVTHTHHHHHTPTSAPPRQATGEPTSEAHGSGAGAGSGAATLAQAELEQLSPSRRRRLEHMHHPHAALPDATLPTPRFDKPSLSSSSPPNKEAMGHVDVRHTTPCTNNHTHTHTS